MGGFPLNPTAFSPALAAPCCAAAARASSFSGALASSLTVGKSEHLLKGKADGRQSGPRRENCVVGAECLLPTALLISWSPLPASSVRSHAAHPKPSPARLQPKPQHLIPAPSSKRPLACASSMPGHLFLHPDQQRPKIGGGAKEPIPCGRLGSVGAEHNRAFPLPPHRPGGGRQLEGQPRPYSCSIAAGAALSGFPDLQSPHSLTQPT